MRLHGERGLLRAVIGNADKTLFLLAACVLPSPALAASLRLTAFDAGGRALSAQDLRDYISPRPRRRAGPSAGVFLTDMDGNPVPGRPWWVADSSAPVLAWSGATRVRISMPWPVAGEGFSTVSLDREGAGFADGDSVLLNEEIALTQYRLFRESLQERIGSWDPPYKPGRKTSRLQKRASDALARARAAKDARERAMLHEKALSALSAAWIKTLYEHGAAVARHPKAGAGLRWGLTLDDTLLHRLGDYDRILEGLESSGANWVRLVFRLNPEDFEYAERRSTIEYDSIVADLAARKIHVMGSVLDSALWPRDLEPESLARRAANLVLHFKDRVRSWEVASEPNGTCLGGCRDPVPDETVLRAVAAAAAEVKRPDPGLETVATVYWWEGTSPEDGHATFPWLKRAIAAGAFSQIDLVAMSVYPEENPMGMAFDPAFRRLAQYFPSKRVMLGGFGYASRPEIDGYWWLDPEDAQAAREDLLGMLTGAACAAPRSAGGGFWWSTLSQMIDARPGRDSLLRAYRRTVSDLRR